MAVEAIDWGTAPDLLDANDGTIYALGVEFTVSESVPCPGVQWWAPATLTPAPTGGYAVSLFQDGVGLIRQQAFTPTVGGEIDVLWGAGPVTLTPGNTYTCQVYTQRYTFRGSSSYPYATASGIASAIRGKLAADVLSPNTEATGSAPASRFYVSPLIGADDPGVGASMALTMPALAAQLNAGAGIGAGLSLGLPALDLALVGDVSGPEPVDDVMTLAAVMDEIAGVLRAYGGWKTVHAQPPASVAAVPAAIVGYPEDVTYQLTMGRNALERYQRLAVHAIVGRIPGSVATNRARVSRWATGSQSIRVALETHTWESCDTVHVGNAEIGMIDFNGVDYLQVTFFIEINGLGG